MKVIQNNSNQDGNSKLSWKSLDIETKIALPVILVLVIGIFMYNYFSGVLKK